MISGIFGIKLGASAANTRYNNNVDLTRDAPQFQKLSIRIFIAHLGKFRCIVLPSELEIETCDPSSGPRLALNSTSQKVFSNCCQSHDAAGLTAHAGSRDAGSRKRKA